MAFKMQALAGKESAIKFHILIKILINSEIRIVISSLAEIAIKTIKKTN